MARLIFLCAAVALSSCAQTRLEAPSRADLGTELVQLNHPGPPEGPLGACWSKSTTPAIIETETEQILVQTEVKAADGAETSPARYRTETRQRIVQERTEIWYRTPCAEAMTVEFIATLQRALKARGLYLFSLTGILDSPTIEAVRRFQADRGLDSGVLSLAAARELGLVSTELDRL